jgi:CBS domain-containing protein
MEMEAPKDLGKEFPNAIGTAYAQDERDPERQREVREIMTREVVTIAPESTLYEAARIMGEKHIGSLIVLKYETPVGMITERDLLSKVTDSGIDLEKDWIVGGASIKEEKVEKFMSYPLITIRVTAKIKEAAQMMIEKKIRRLAVFEGGKLVGIVTTSDLLRSLPEVPETMNAWFEVDYFMTKHVISTDEKTPVDRVAKVMGENRIGSVIVTSQGEPIGIFTERDLVTAFLAKDKSLILEVGEACSSPLITAPIGISIHDAATIMTTKHIKRLPITREGKLVGILTARDLVEAYARAH